MHDCGSQGTVSPTRATVTNELLSGVGTPRDDRSATRKEMVDSLFVARNKGTYDLTTRGNQLLLRR